MGGRLYDSRIGRVLQADPPFMESPFWSQGLNRYSYVFNNPLNLVDPSGHQASDEDDVDIEEQELPTIEIVGTHGGAASPGAPEGGDDEKETSPAEDPDDEADTSDYDQSESLTPKSSSIPEIPGILDVIGGFGLGFAQGAVPGGTFLPMPPGSTSYQIAVALGQIIGGLQALQSGSTLAAGGALASTTGVGAPAGAPAVVVGVGVAAGGGVNVVNGVGNVLQISSSAGPPETGTVVGVTVKPKGKPQMTGSVDLKPTLDRIKGGGTYPHPNDGSVFKNNEGLLPAKPNGYYHEYVHPTPGTQGPGPQRVVTGAGGELYYTPDHYQTFIPLN